MTAGSITNLLDYWINNNIIQQTIISSDGIIYIGNNNHYLINMFNPVVKRGLCYAIALTRNENSRLREAIGTVLTEIKELEQTLGQLRKIEQLNNRYHFLEDCKIETKEKNEILL